jgi:sec-independent protein translocase protein TatA
VFQFLNGTEWLIILLVILLIFGPTKLPQLAKGIGQAFYEFRRASQGLIEENEKKTKKNLEEVDEETLKKLAEKLGVKNADEKKKDELISEIITEAKKKGLIQDVKVESN